MKIPYQLRVLFYRLKFRLTGQRRIQPTITVINGGPWFNGSYPYQALKPGENNRIINGDMVVDQARPDRRYGEWTWGKDAEL